jgi:hypothetical protein
MTAIQMVLNRVPTGRRLRRRRLCLRKGRTAQMQRVICPKDLKAAKKSLVVPSW